MRQQPSYGVRKNARAIDAVRRNDRQYNGSKLVKVGKVFFHAPVLRVSHAEDADVPKLVPCCTVLPVDMAYQATFTALSGDSCLALASQIAVGETLRRLCRLETK